MNYIESDDIYHISSARWAEVSDEPFYDDYDYDYSSDEDEDEDYFNE
jgi:hypothetical protein